MKIVKLWGFIEECLSMALVYVVGILLAPLILIEFLLMKVFLDDD